jgi:hypothetical protein
MHDRHQGQVDRPLLPDLDLVEVAGRASILHAPRTLDGAGDHQQRLSQCGLARPGMADQRDVAHPPWLVGHWCTARAR